MGRSIKGKTVATNKHTSILPLAETSLGIQLRATGRVVLDLAELLSQMLANPVLNSKDPAARVERLARGGRDLVKTFLRMLDHKAVKPFNSRQMRNASKALLKMLALLERASFHLQLLEPKESIPFTEEIARIICRQSRGITSALTRLVDGSEPSEACGEILCTKDDVDRLYESSLCHLFESVNDSIELIKRKQLIDDLIEASKSALKVGYILGPRAYYSLSI